MEPTTTKTACKRQRPGSVATETMANTSNILLDGKNAGVQHPDGAITMPCDPLWLVQQDPFLNHFMIRELLLIDQRERAPRKIVSTREYVLTPAFHWREAPELEMVLSKHTKDFYGCIGETRGSLIERILLEIGEKATEVGYSFDVGGEKAIKSRVRSFYNTLWQSVKKKMIKETDQHDGRSASSCRAAVARILTALLDKASTSLEILSSKYPEKETFTQKVIEAILPVIPEMRLAVNLHGHTGRYSRKHLEEHVSFDDDVSHTTSKRTRISVPLNLMERLTVPPPSHKLWKDGENTKVEAPENPDDTNWIEAPAESSPTNFVWKRYTRCYPQQIMLEWKPTLDRVSYLQQLETFATLVRVRLASGLVRSALNACHQRLIRLYRDLESNLLYKRTDHLMVWRHHLAACWCLYAHTWLEFDDLLTLPAAAALRQTAAAILSAATNCSVVGNHAWITISLARMVGQVDRNRATDILWDGIDRAKAIPVKPRVLLQAFQASSLVSMSITSRWKITALRQEKVSAKQLQSTLQKVLDLPAFLPQRPYLVVDKESEKIVSKEISVWGTLGHSSTDTDPLPESESWCLATVLPRFRFDPEALMKHAVPPYEYQEQPILPLMAIKPAAKVRPAAVERKNGYAVQSHQILEAKPNPFSSVPSTQINASHLQVSSPPLSHPSTVTLPQASLFQSSVAIGGATADKHMAIGVPASPRLLTNAGTPRLESDSVAIPFESAVPPTSAMEVEQVCPCCNSLFSADKLLAHRQVCRPTKNGVQFATPQNTVPKL